MFPISSWAHARRNFYEAREHVPPRAKWILRQIAKLYAVEASLREIGAGPNLRSAIRASHRAPIYRRIHHALVAFKKSGHHLPRSSFGKAIDYALSNWSLLGVYLQDGCVEIDNNLVYAACGINQPLRLPPGCALPTALGHQLDRPRTHPGKLAEQPRPFPPRGLIISVVAGRYDIYDPKLSMRSAV